MYKIPHRAFPELDALRFFSVLMIVIHHLFSRETVVLRWFSDYGSVGVDIFFVISGFIITHNLLKEFNHSSNISIRNFWLNRLLRLWPSWFVVFSVFLLVSPWYENWWHYFIPYGNYSLIESGVYQNYSLFWSLAVEEHFYFVWPLVLLGILRYPKSKVLIISSLLLIPLGFRMYYFTMGAKPEMIRFATHTRFDQLVVGCILAFMITKISKLSFRAELWITVAAIASFGLSVYGNSLAYTLTALGSALLIIIALKGGDYGLRAILRNKFLANLGILSYGIYLVHVLFIILVFKLSGIFKYRLNEYEVVGLVFSGSTIAAYLLYIFIDVPVKRLREILNSRSTRPN